MLQLKSERGEEHWHDTSEIWASRVDQPNRYETDPKAALVRTLTFACVQVYEQAGQDPVQLETLDHALREARWLLFTRVRHHLYSQYPAYAQKWIQDSILEYTNYDTWEYHFEFQRMIRRGIEHFGTELISRDQLTRIFERILSGPPQDRFQEFMGDRYTEESFVQ